MLANVKLALRITSNAFDTEINSLIEACKADLKLSGVKKIDTGNPLIERAIVIYAKIHFGFNDDSEKLERSYEFLKRALCFSGGCNAVE